MYISFDIVGVFIFAILNPFQIRDAKEFEKCKAWKLNQLKLAGNPVTSVATFQT